MATQTKQDPRVVIDKLHHKRLAWLVQNQRPQTDMGGMLEHLIDTAIESRGFDPETLKPAKNRKTA